MNADEWIYQPGRTEIFQAWLDSLETKTVKRIRAQVDGVRAEYQKPKGKK